MTRWFANTQALVVRNIDQAAVEAVHPVLPRHQRLAGIGRDPLRRVPSATVDVARLVASTTQSASYRDVVLGVGEHVQSQEHCLSSSFVLSNTDPTSRLYLRRHVCIASMCSHDAQSGHAPEFASRADEAVRLARVQHHYLARRFCAMAPVKPRHRQPLLKLHPIHRHHGGVLRLDTTTIHPDRRTSCNLAESRRESSTRLPIVRWRPGFVLPSTRCTAGLIRRSAQGRVSSHSSVRVWA